MMMKFRTNAAQWVEAGKRAANAGKRDEALHAMCTLFSLMFSVCETIIDNQFELAAAIAKADNGKSKP